MSGLLQSSASRRQGNLTAATAIKFIMGTPVAVSVAVECAAATGSS